MDSSEPDVFVDHKESIITVPRPRQMSASKMEVVPVEETESAQTSSAETKVTTQTAFQEPESTVTTQETVSITKESSASSAITTKKVEKFATTVYTQRISGRSSDSGSDISSPTEEGSGQIFGSRNPEGAQSPTVFGHRDGHSPTEVCSVQFNVAAGVSSNTTTVFSKLFTKTVDTSTEASSKERHLSECSISVGEASAMPHSQETRAEEASEEPTDSTKGVDGQESLAEHMNDYGLVFTEAVSGVKPEEEKEVSEYCPGLAIRTLTLEDLQEKKTSPEREFSSTNTSTWQATDMSTTSLFAKSSSTTTAESGYFSSAGQSGNSMFLPEDSSAQAGFSSSESSTSQMSFSQSSTSMTSSAISSSLTSGGQALMQCTEDSATTLRKPFFNPIEVERKFTIAEDTEERLRSLGARLHKEKTFTDVYFDNDDYALILTDCWLRRRNDSWEAKIPLKSQNCKALFAPASQYREITDEKEISAWLVERLGLERWMRGDPIDLLVQAAGLREFARFSTTRRSYMLPSCVVDLDLTSHGFRVGEIEVMAASPEEVPQALQTISGVARQLGKDGFLT